MEIFKNKTNLTLIAIIAVMISIAINLNIFARPVDVSNSKLAMKTYTDSVVCNAVQDLKLYINERFAEQEKLIREISKKK